MQSLPLLSLVLLAACAAAPSGTSAHAFRLLPGEDLQAGIQRYVDEHDIEAGWVATCVGSLTEWTLRFADRQEHVRGSGHFEIVSLCGTVSVNGSHLHLAISDGDGRTIGGHLVPGCVVYTTAEIVLGESREHVFAREVDGSTPWRELQVRRR